MRDQSRHSPASIDYSSHRTDLAHMLPQQSLHDIEGNLCKDTQVIATHLRADARDVRDVDWSVPTAVVLGNEREGATRLPRLFCVCARSNRAVLRVTPHIVAEPA